jgi:probable rRNA maturation factor
MKGKTDKLMGASKTGPRSKPDSISNPAPHLAVDVIHHVPSWVSEVEDEFLVRVADAAFSAGADAPPRSELSLLLTADEEIRALNKSWRGKDEATNVLSFSLDAPFSGEAPRPLGDVVLAYETVAREAAARGIPVRQHAAHLVVHGVLHLLGYTHGTDSQARDMEALEVRVLEALGMPDPYGLELTTTGEGQ